MPHCLPRIAVVRGAAASYVNAEPHTHAVHTPVYCQVHPGAGKDVPTELSARGEGRLQPQSN